jgi:hypothetical protein
MQLQEHVMTPVDEFNDTKQQRLAAALACGRVSYVIDEPSVNVWATWSVEANETVSAYRQAMASWGNALACADVTIPVTDSTTLLRVEVA